MKIIIIASLALIMAAEVCMAQNQEKFTVPLQMTVSGFCGVSTSFIEGEGLFEKYFAPTTKTENVTGRPFGVAIEGLLTNYLGVSLGLRSLKFGQNTGSQQVMFADDIFTHDLKTIAEVEYLGAPVLVKAGLMTKKFWAFFRFGVMGMMLVDSKLDWQIDGHSAIAGSYRMPAVALQETTSSYIGGFESGAKFGKNGIVLMVDYFYGRSTIASGLSGKAFHRGAEVCVGYKRFLDPIKLQKRL